MLVFIDRILNSASFQFTLLGFMLLFIMIISGIVRCVGYIWERKEHNVEKEQSCIIKILNLSIVSHIWNTLACCVVSIIVMMVMEQFMQFELLPYIIGSIVGIMTYFIIGYGLVRLHK